MESSGSNASNGKVWAERRGKDEYKQTKISSDPLSCHSIGSLETPRHTLTMAERESVIPESPNSEPGLKKQTSQNAGEVSLDFSNIGEIATSPSAKSVLQPGSIHSLNSQFSAPYKQLDHPADKSLILSFFSSICFLIGSLVVFCLVVVIYVVILPLGWLIKRCMACCCCCAGNRTCACCCSKMLQHADALWLHDSDLNRMIVQSLITLEHGLEMTRIRDIINARLISAEGKRGEKLYPRFTQKIVPLYSGYAWEHDPNFNIENHVFRMPNDVRTTEDLEQYVADMAMMELQQNKPMWEIHVLTNFGETKDTVVLVRIHPSISDGISLVRLMFKSILDTHSTNTLKPRYGQSAYLFNAARAIIIGPLIFLQKWIFTRKDHNLIHSTNLSGQKVVAWSAPFNFGRATRIKQVTRSTLNDILLSVVAGNLRTYLQVQGVQNPYDMLVNIPIDLRTDGPNIQMGTQFTLTDMTLPTNTEGAIPRLWEIKQRMDELKNSTDPIVMHGSRSILMNIFPKCLYDKIFNMLMNKTTCVISNLQGPDAVMKFASREVKSMMYWLPPADEVALSISFFTYADQLRMAVIADRAVIQHPEIITKDFVFQLETLAQLLSNRRTPGEHPSRRVDLSLHDDLSNKEPSIGEIQSKMSEVQLQLQDLKSKLDTESQDQYSEEKSVLVDKVEELKEEFRELLKELRRKRVAEGSAILSDDEDEEDGAIRRPSYRRRTLSSTSRRSIVSNTSTARPLTTSLPDTQHASPPLSTHSTSPPQTAQSQVSVRFRSYSSGQTTKRLQRPRHEVLQFVSPRSARQVRLEFAKGGKDVDFIKGLRDAQVARNTKDIQNTKKILQRQAAQAYLNQAGMDNTKPRVHDPRYTRATREVKEARAKGIYNEIPHRTNRLNVTASSSR